MIPTDKFNRLTFKNSLKEMIGLRLYYDGKYYFYCWNADHALRKTTTNQLFLINDYGHKINVMKNLEEGTQSGY